MSTPLTDEQRRRYHQDGYLVLPGFLTGPVIAPLAAALEERPGLFCKVGPLDYVGWTLPGDDLAGSLSRHARLVEAAEALVGEPCYHYHTKIVRKPPGRGETLPWHQDFGSWYKDGCLMPSMLTCVVALTPATRANGCFRVMRGSNRMGRLDRLKEGHDSYSYFSLAPERLKAIEQRFAVDEIEMSPGDVFFFHANTLHSTGPNASDGPRILLEITYNAITNPPVFEHQEFHAVRPLVKVPETGFAEGGYDTVIGRTRLVDIDDPDDPGTGLFRRGHDPGLC